MSDQDGTQGQGGDGTPRRKGPGGRPSKLDKNDQIRDLFVTAVSLGMTYTLAAKHARVGKSTIYNWMSRGEKARTGKYREFLDAVHEAEARGAMTALAVIMKAARQGKRITTRTKTGAETVIEEPGDWRAAAFLLERRHGYIRPVVVAPEKAELDPNYKPPQAIAVLQLAGLTRDDLLALSGVDLDDPLIVLPTERSAARAKAQT